MRLTIKSLEGIFISRRWLCAGGDVEVDGVVHGSGGAKEVRGLSSAKYDHSGVQNAFRMQKMTGEHHRWYSASVVQP